MQTHILAFLFFLQSFIACQQDQEKAGPLAVANIDFSSIGGSAQDSVKAPPSVATIVFQSVDGGQTWQDASAGLPAGLEVWGLSTVGSEVFLGATTGLYRSSTTPATPVWQKETFLGTPVSNIFPGRAGVYALNYDNGLFQEVLSGTGMWKPVYTALKNKGIRTIVETPDGAVLIGCDSGIFKSADGGQTWKQVFEGTMVISLFASGDVLVGSGYQGVLRSTDGGEHWEVVLDRHILAKRAGIIGDRFFTILGTEDPFVLTPEGITNRLLTSADGGKTWQRIDGDAAPLPVQGNYNMDQRLSQVRDIYDIIQVGGDLFCSFDTGIFRSSDQGKTWELVLKGSFNLAGSGKVIYAVKGGGGC